MASWSASAEECVNKCPFLVLHAILRLLETDLTVGTKNHVINMEFRVKSKTSFLCDAVKARHEIVPLSDCVTNSLRTGFRERSDGRREGRRRSADKRREAPEISPFIFASPAERSPESLFAGYVTNPKQHLCLKGLFFKKIIEREKSEV